MCEHRDTECVPWPDGGDVEVCRTCGMSRHHWEQGSSAWVMVDDIDAARRELMAFMTGAADEDVSQCPRCDGSGRYQRFPSDESEPCSICNGTGKIGADGLGLPAPTQSGGAVPGIAGEE